MPQSTLAGVITAAAAVFTSLALVITAIGGLLAARRVGRKVDEVHVIVNQQRTDTMNYQRALIAALERHGVEVPADQSVDTTTTPRPV
jgi:Na+-transporting NADH:ubiquinone oxidoreductase subunit NqrF